VRHLKVIAVVASILATATPLSAAEPFIEGFPDVPLLEGLEEIEGERIVFDTPSGTVAKTVLTAKSPAAGYIASYAASLPSFGWTCERQELVLRCKRDNNSLMFKVSNPKATNGRIILRLEPKK